MALINARKNLIVLKVDSDEVHFHSHQPHIAAEINLFFSFYEISSPDVVVQQNNKAVDSS